VAVESAVYGGIHHPCDLLVEQCAELDHIRGRFGLDWVVDVQSV
jgi:hypothetical protein